MSCSIPLALGAPRIEHVHSAGLSRQDFGYAGGDCYSSDGDSTQSKAPFHLKSVSLFPVTVQAQERSRACPYRVYQHITVERHPSPQTISNRSRRYYSMHGLVPEPCSLIGRTARLAGENGGVHTRSPSVSIIGTLNGVANWCLYGLATCETSEIYATL